MNEENELPTAPPVLDLDDIDFDSVINEDFDDEPEIEDPVPEEVIEQTTIEKKLPVPSNEFNVDIIQPPEQLRSMYSTRQPMALRFPIAKMSVGDAFVIDSDSKSPMRKALKYDLTKLKKQMSRKDWEFKIFIDDDDIYYLKRVS